MKLEYKFLKFKFQVKAPLHCTEVRFASFLSGGFTTLAVINPPEMKLAKRTSVKSEAKRVAKLNFFACVA